MYANTTHVAMSRMASLVAAVAISFVSLSAFAGGQAAQRDAAPTVAVHYGDLDLSTAAGNRALYQRLTWAAKRVCPDADNRDLTRVAAVRACRESALDGAVRRSGNAQLTALHAQSSRRG